ncbi:MAG TPA: hypothetical protein VHC20_04490 [Candidatus Paceibacterota bacterium]|nr:hypothetical protein [Candidatus Paceibacterota bacterium]
MGAAYLDAGMHGWLKKTARQEFWKVAEYYELSDLLQDGYMCFAKCAKAYPELSTVEKPNAEQRRIFMGAVMTAFHNHIATLATKRMRLHETALTNLYGETSDATWDKLLPEQPEQQSLLALLANAPAEIKQLILILAKDSAELLRFQRRRVGRHRVRETTNEYYCRLLGLDPKQEDVVGRLKSYFGTV